ncbi:MAG: response regulator [Cyanobacteria bacterium REEB67]|nr:response regulator [Cyanobacteria bacterium REEB67]
MEQRQSGDSLKKSTALLLVEDSITNQKVALVLIQRLGLSADIALNGQEAVEAVKNNRYGLILMDCLMPDMDGFEATRAIRRLQQPTQIYTPILAVTALAMQGDRERCLAAGMDDYISKPLDKELFNLKVKHWLQPEAVSRHQMLTREQWSPLGQKVSGDEQLLDLHEIEAFYGRETVGEMMANFFRNAENKTRRLKTYMAERDATVVAGLAYEMKISSAAIGARSLENLCLWLQRAAVMEDWLEASQALVSIEDLHERLKKYLLKTTQTHDLIRQSTSSLPTPKI